MLYTPSCIHDPFQYVLGSLRVHRSFNMAPKSMSQGPILPQFVAKSALTINMFCNTMLSHNSACFTGVGMQSLLWGSTSSSMEVSRGAHCLMISS